MSKSLVKHLLHEKEERYFCDFASGGPTSLRAYIISSLVTMYRGKPYAYKDCFGVAKNKLLPKWYKQNHGGGEFDCDTLYKVFEHTLYGICEYVDLILCFFCSGEHTYDISYDLMFSLMTKDLSGVRGDTVRLPYHTISFTVPNNMLPLEWYSWSIAESYDRTDVFIDEIVVNESKSDDGFYTLAIGMFYRHPVTELVCGVSDYVELENGVDVATSIYNSVDGFIQDLKDDDAVDDDTRERMRSSIFSITQFVLNVIMHISNSDKGYNETVG